MKRPRVYVVKLDGLYWTGLDLARSFDQRVALAHCFPTYRAAWRAKTAMLSLLPAGKEPAVFRWTLEEEQS